MRSIVWRPVAGKYCAYLELNREESSSGNPVSRHIYLGNTPERAAARLRRLAGGDDDYLSLIMELYRRRPGRKPPVNEREKVARSLRRLAARYKDECVQAVLKRALIALESGISDGPGCP